MAGEPSGSIGPATAHRTLHARSPKGLDTTNVSTKSVSGVGRKSEQTGEYVINVCTRSFAEAMLTVMSFTPSGRWLIDKTCGTRRGEDGLCDDDDDCEVGLACAERLAFAEVPGHGTVSYKLSTCSALAEHHPRGSLILS